jgi:hypothetical protein
MQYSRDREEVHRNTNESTNARVMWFSMLTVLTLVALSAGQVWHLYAFFKKKKYL